MVILCNPNNPTGQLVPPGYMAEICRICEQNEIYLLSDECFLDLTENGFESSARRHMPLHVIVLNAFTKTYAIPGLRLGYAVFGDSQLAARVQDAGQYWSVSVPAQTAGLAALDETAYLEHARQVISKERKFLIEELQNIGLHCFTSDANFILFQGKTGLFAEMLESHFLIRSCENFEGLDGTFYRIAVRSHEENVLLLQALRRCCHG
jgi:threonine-phosphate decarboxylase